MEPDNLSFGQKIILAFLINNKIIKGKTKLQKYAFLLEQEYFTKPYLDFEPWYYGPYSRRLNNQLDDLIDYGFVEEAIIENEKYDFYIFSLVGNIEVYAELVDSDLIEKARMILEKFGDMSYNELLTFVYSEYPDFTKRSII